MFPIIFFINVVPGFTSIPNIYAYAFVMVIIVIAASIRYKFTIHNDHLMYEMTLFKRSILKKRVIPDEIKQIRFVRVDWAKKAAKIKLHKGLPIRLAVLQPVEAYDHLLAFSDKHEIQIVKTKDYLLLERMQ